MLLQKRPYDSGPNGCGAGVDKPIHRVAASAGGKNLMELVAYAIKARENERDKRGGEVAEHACGVRDGVFLERGPRREAQRVCKRRAEQQIFREVSNGRDVDLVAEDRRSAHGQKILDDRDNARVIVEVVASFRAHKENEGEHNRDGRPRKKRACAPRGARAIRGFALFAKRGVFCTNAARIVDGGRICVLGCGVRLRFHGLRFYQIGGLPSQRPRFSIT